MNGRTRHWPRTGDERNVRTQRRRGPTKPWLALRFTEGHPCRRVPPATRKLKLDGKTPGGGRHKPARRSLGRSITASSATNKSSTCKNEPRNPTIDTRSTRSVSRTSPLFAFRVSLFEFRHSTFPAIITQILRRKTDASTSKRECHRVAARKGARQSAPAL